MKSHLTVITLIALSIAGCAEKEPVVPEAVDEAQAPPPAVETSAAPTEPWLNDEFLKHMHRHADELDELNLALADGDLETAISSANWLSRHEPITSIPPELQQYLDGMREAARDVGQATDLEGARVPAERITDNCQGCHIAAGIVGN
jgi:hypothetical protein